jgi:diguanylate cyclase (GGDEF)-like protein/PAS domain S-box-containing protein
VTRSPAELFADRIARLLLRRHLALVTCLVLAAVDDFIAVTIVGPSPASHLAVPLAFLTTGVAALGFGMWPGIVAAGSLGLCAALLPSTENGLVLVASDLVFGGLLGRVRDLSVAVRRGGQALRRATERFAAIAEGGADLVLLFDGTGNATYANDAHATILGRAPGAMLRLGFYDAFGPSGVSQLIEAFEKTPPGHSERIELGARHSDGTTRVLDATLRNATHEPALGGFILHARDVSEIKNAEQRLIAATTHDALTCLPNRALMATRLDEALAERGDKQIALLLIDIDRFKDVNDVLGHPAGDDLLVQVTARLLASIREGDLVARIGGDEFAIMLGRTKDTRDAAEVAARIRATVVAPYVLGGRDIVVGASVGLALAGEGLDATMLLRRADVAMHAAKRRRDGVSIFSKMQDERANRRLTMGSALAAAIVNDEFVLHYQPQIDVRTGVVRAAEALVRWEHPDRGLLYPDFFLPIAEEVGELDRLTDWILYAALKRVRRWNRAGHGMRVAVNLRPHDLRDDRLAEIVPRLLSQTGVEAHALCLELAETTIMTEAESAAECLRALSERGVRISIDDFGTGRSGLSHLRTFPIDEIKIDKQFVINIEQDAGDAAIVASTIDLAHRLSVEVVVEGVERSSTLEAITAMGAQYAQGYAIGRPLAPSAFDAWIYERRGLRAIANG